MATTKNYFTGDGTTTDFTFTFPYLQTSHIKVTLDKLVQATTEYTLQPTNNPTLVRFNTAPTSDVQIEIYRDTSLTNANNVFAAGSSIKAKNLNDNQTQVLYALEENENSIVNGEIFKYANAQHTSGATAPTTPSSGDTWFDSVSGKTYIYYTDTDSSQWVESAPPYNTTGSGALNFPTSPSVNDTYSGTNGVTYTYDGVKWASSGNTTNSILDAEKLDDISGTDGANFNGSTKTFNLTVNGVAIKPLNPQALQISLGGVVQEPGSAYTTNNVNGTITFATAPVNGSDFFGIAYSKLPVAAITNSNFTQTGSVVTRTINAKLTDVVSVKDFGAKGDGTTDDTTAIKNAISALRGGSKGSLYFPAGTYPITQLNLNSIRGIRFIGDNTQDTYAKQTIIQAYPVSDGNLGSASYQFKHLINLRSCGNLIFEGIAFDIYEQPYERIFTLDSNASAGTSVDNAKAYYNILTTTAFKNPAIVDYTPGTTTEAVNGAGSNYIEFRHCAFLSKNSSVSARDNIEGLYLKNTGHITFDYCWFKDGNSNRAVRLGADKVDNKDPDNGNVTLGDCGVTNIDFNQCTFNGDIQRINGDRIAYTQCDFAVRHSGVTGMSNLTVSGSKSVRDEYLLNCICDRTGITDFSGTWYEGTDTTNYGGVTVINCQPAGRDTLFLIKAGDAFFNGNKPLWLEQSQDFNINQANITEASPGVFTSTGHGLVNGNILSYTSNGTNLVTSDGTAADGTRFYVVGKTDNTFKISLTEGGSELQVTNDGNDSQIFKFISNPTNRIFVKAEKTAGHVKVQNTNIYHLVEENEHYVDATLFKDERKHPEGIVFHKIFRGDTALTVGAYGTPGRAVNINQANITEASPGIFTSTAHGFYNGDRIKYTKVGGGTALTTSAGATADGTVFWIVNKTDDNFQISLTEGGAALQVTNDGDDAQTFTDQTMSEAINFPGGNVRFRYNLTMQRTDSGHAAGASEKKNFSAKLLLDGTEIEDTGKRVSITNTDAYHTLTTDTVKYIAPTVGAKVVTLQTACDSGCTGNLTGTSDSSHSVSSDWSVELLDY